MFRKSALGLLGLGLLVSTPVHAEFPTGPFPECAPGAAAACPSDLGENWELISWTPSGAQLDDPGEAEMGSGIAADVAWRRTAGSPDVVIAVLDSGIQWDAGDVRRKVALNQGELPEPAVGPGPGVRGRWALGGAGLLTVADYHWDERVTPDMGVDVSDHFLDGSDLIAAFSDGVDADRNGYVDDIAGWDFHWNDNDPYDDTRFGHGTSEARLSTAEGNDGGRIGSCPNCRFLPVRVGDAFIADADNIAGGILFAVDSGAVVVQGALGALGNHPHVEAAMRYADDSGTVMVFAAGDETSYHHNFPASNAEALFVSANRLNDDSPATSTTFLNNSNCTNYGPRMDLTVPSDGCASGATGRAAGVVGLVWSAGLDAGLEPPLSTAEVRQLLIATSVDIDVELSRGDDADPLRYPSWPGWDQYFGFGRISAGGAVEAVYAGDIPPVAELSSPGWYDVLRDGPTIEVVGRGLAPRDDVASWSLAWAPGGDPRDDAFVEVSSGDGDVDGLLAELDPDDLIAGGVIASSPADARDLLEDNVSRADSAHRDAFTLRLTVTDSQGRVGVARRLAFLQADPDLRPGFPVQIGASMEASPRIADIDGDGRLEIIVVTGAGSIHALDPETGADKPGWPVYTPLVEEVDPAHPGNHLSSDAWRSLGIGRPHEGVVASPSIADLDGDGAQDIVVATMRGHVVAFSGADGSILPGFPVAVDPSHSEHTSPSIKVERGFLGSPAIEDLDGDGDWELIAPAMDGWIYVWHHDGALLEGWPVPIVSLGPGNDPLNRVVSSPASGDVDGDGQLDVVVGSNEALSSQYALLFAIHGDGLAHDGPAYLEGFPVAVFAGYTEVLPVVGEGMPTSPSLADVNGDGLLEIGANAIADPGVIWGSDGQPFTNLKATREHFGGGHNSREDALLQMMNNGAWGDLDGDGVPEFVNGATGIGFASGFLDDGNRNEFDHLVAAWDAVSGEFMWGFPQVTEDLQFFMNPAIADISGDDRPEVITGSGGYLIHAWDVTGAEAPGYPKSTGGWIAASPAVGDLDHDGFLDLVVATRDGYVFAWRTRGLAWGNIQWATFHHDNRSTGNLHTPLPRVPPPELGATGCGGCSVTAAPSAGLLCLPLLALFWRRRP